MNKRLSASILAGALMFGGVGGAAAVGAAQPVPAGASLAQYMNDDKDAEWDKVQTWLEANGIEAQPEELPAEPAEPTPAPEPEPATGETKTGFVTGYTIHDNDPAGSKAIAYSSQWTSGTIHTEAGGVGTFEDPITVAAEEGDYAPGTKFYFPHLERYGILEDTCASCGDRDEWVDIWVGGELPDSATDTDQCARDLTGDFEFVVNPEAGLPVTEGSLFNSETDECVLPTDGQEPAPAPEPTEEPAPEPEAPTEVALTGATAVATDDNRIVLTGNLSGYTGEVTFRASSNPLTGQAGYPVQGTVGADGVVELEVTDFNNTDPQHWQLERGGSTYTYGEVIASGPVTQDEVAEPAPEEPGAPAPSDGNSTGGSGGAFTNRTFQSFTSAGQTSQYHVYAEGRSENAGLLFWADGSGGYGFDNPSSSYLIGGSQGMNAIAKARDMILVVPVAPAPGCPSDNCWYDSNGAKKAEWSSDLMTHIKGQYNINEDRIAIGGYSSGAEWTTRFFMPLFGEEQSVDLALPMAYGGRFYVDADFSDAYKANTTIAFNTGTNDQAAYDQARGGYNYYTGLGFDTEWEQSSTTHSRSGDFGPFAAQNIDEHLG